MRQIVIENPQLIGLRRTQLVSLLSGKIEIRATAAIFEQVP